MKVAVDGANCEADGHPTSCEEPADGSVNAPTTGVTINGTPVGTHGGSMYFPSHAHEYKDTDDDGSKECTTYSSHSLDPDQTHSVTVNGEPIYRVGDSTTDPGSGGTAYIIDSGGSHQVTHNA
jgi:uncharacterized Zn-binding protein involved in type VI secretion